MRSNLAILFVILFTQPMFAQSEPRGPSTGPEKKSPPEFEELTYRLIGPFCGGRVSRAVGVPGDPLTYYIASASGGVWKSVDGGISFEPIFDNQPVSSIGSIAVAPSDPNVIYVGSGEANIRGNVAAGNGVYKSTDAGKSWKHVWKQIGHIGQMAVHPKNPDIAFAAVLGHAFGPNTERGIYRTTNGGKTWERVLYKDENTGGCDITFDQGNPRILFAALWEVRRKPWEMTSGGPFSGLYVSHDNGDSWKSLKEDAPKNGLPEGLWGKVGIAIAPSDSRRIYALIEAEKGGLYRSEDGGEKWEYVNSHHIIRQRAWYFFTLTVDPSNRDHVIFPQVPLLHSIDGGKTLKQMKGAQHGDHHDCWIDPHNPKRMIVANDGGVDITTNAGEKWYTPALPLVQFYHITCDNRNPYHVLGCMQDQGTACGPSHSLNSGGILLSHWFSVGGGEAGHAVADPNDPNIVYAGEYSGYISRYDHRTRLARNVTVYPFDSSGFAPKDLKVRFQWTAPILISKYDNKTIYHAANVLFRSKNAGHSWERASPDLTRNDRNKQNFSGGPLTGDNTGVEIYDTIFALAESGTPEKPTMWAGSDDGLLHLTRDNGKTWENLTANIPDMPDWGTIKCIEPSPHDPATIYVIADAHRLDDYRPYLWRTTDNGKIWTKLTAGLDQDVYLHVVREDPRKKGLLFLGTERCVMLSYDTGKTWQPLKLNMPTVAIHDLVIKNDDLVVGTNGRSAWILDDITPIREWSKAIADQSMHLFPPRITTHWRRHGEVSEHVERLAKGENPPNGVIVNYSLKTEPKKPIRFEVLNAEKKSIVVYNSDEATPEPDEALPDGSDVEAVKPEIPTKVGVNRFVWDMRHSGSKFIDRAKLDYGDPTVGPFVAPGWYTIKLTVDGKTESAVIRIDADPRTLSKSSPEVMKANVEKLPAPHVIGDEMETFQLRIRDDISKVSEMVTTLRLVRKQIEVRAEALIDEEGPNIVQLRMRSKVFANKLNDLEAKLHNPKAEVVYDILAQRGGAKLYSQLSSLLEYARDGDGPPSKGMVDQFADYEKELTQLASEYESLMSKELVKLNEYAQQRGYPTIWVPKKK